MSLLAETELLASVRSAVQTALTLSASEITIEMDEEVPAIAGDKHVVVSPAGIIKGPRHNRATGTVDFYVAVRVCVYRRITAIPRDRRREQALMDRLKSINADLDTIMDAIDFKYPILDTVNTAMSIPSGGGFIEPLRFGSFDTKPTPVFKDVYAAGTGTPGDPILAIKRGINFDSARFMRVRT